MNEVKVKLNGKIVSYNDDILKSDLALSASLNVESKVV
jgi:hypothetical protein